MSSVQQQKLPLSVWDWSHVVWGAGDETWVLIPTWEYPPGNLGRECVQGRTMGADPEKGL